MLCCLDASVANDDVVVHTRANRRPPKKKKEFEEVEMQMGSHARLNGRIPTSRREPSIQSSETEDGGGEEEEEDSQPRSEEEGHQAHQGHKGHHQGHKEMEQDDDFSQMDLMQHQLQQLQKERDDYKSRLSWYASSALRDGNPNIVDLSDPNRPDALSQRAAELYDNQWTDAFIYLTDNRMDEKAAITILVDMLRTVYRVCKTLASQQMNSLGSQIGFFTGFDQVPQYLLPTVQMYKDERKKNYKKFLPVLEKKARKYVRTVRGLGDHFFLEALETCWLICIQDPPMAFDFACFPGDVFDSKSFRPFTTPGSHVDFIVWPALRLHESGPLLTKGFAQGRKGGIPTHHSVTRRLTSDTRPERGSVVYRRRDNSAHLSKISESSQEYQTSFPSSHRSAYSKSHSSERSSRLFMSGYDTKSQASKIASIRDQHRRDKDFQDFLKNADFKAEVEIDSSEKNDQTDFKTEEEIDSSEKNDHMDTQDTTERFSVPGRQRVLDENANENTDSYLQQINTQPEAEQFVDFTLTGDRTFINEETQTSENGTPSTMKRKIRSGRFKSPDHSVDLSQNSLTDPTLQPDTNLFNQGPHAPPQYMQQDPAESSDDEFFDGPLDDEMDDDRKPNRMNSSAHMAHIPEEYEDSNDMQPNKPIDRNHNVIPKTPIGAASPAVDKTKRQRSSESPAIVGILKNERREYSDQPMSPSETYHLSAKRAAVRKEIKRALKRNTPESSVDSRSIYSGTPPLTPLKADLGSLSKKADRNTDSPVRELTVKINKIKRIPKRVYPDDSRNATNETRQPRGKIRAYNRTSKKTIHSSHVHHTPRNVPSVESCGVSSLDTIVLSRNTPRKPSDITPRHTTRTVTPVPTHRSNIHSRHKKAFEYDPKSSREDSKHVPGNEKSKETQGPVANDSSRLNDRQYVSRALTDYTPRQRAQWRAPPAVKQYPAMTPDFSNSLTLAPNTVGRGNIMLAPKPPPKIPGTVAANLRFETN